jgi:hypothetical protein
LSVRLPIRWVQNTSSNARQHRASGKLRFVWDEGELYYFGGELLDAEAFEVEQEYLRPRVERRGVLVLEIDGGEGFEVWEEVVDLAGSGAGDRHFVVDLDLGLVRFGDGECGRRPPVGAQVRGRYRRGGGGGDDPD